MIPRFDCRHDENWLGLTTAALVTEGFAVVEGVLRTAPEFAAIREALYAAAAKIKADIGEQKLKEASELSVLRFPMRYEPAFLEILELPELLAVVDEFLSPSAVMRFQVGIIMQAKSRRQGGNPHWHDYHVNFPHVSRVPRLAIDCALFLTDITEVSGAVEVFPGSHLRSTKPNFNDPAHPPLLVTLPAGSMFLIDGAVWHREQSNESDEDKLYVTHQFSLPIMKQQFDYCKGLGEDTIQSLPERTRRLLGWEARVPASLQEFYLPKEQRLYRA